MNIFKVDAFTDMPFRGNPAGVCILKNQKDEKWMQAVAAEMNVSETAFLFREGDHYNLRWFTPVSEVDLCGHATLASAHVLYETKMEQPAATIVFKTKSGDLSSSSHGEFITLDFPAQPADEVEPPEALIGGLGMKPLYAGKSRVDYVVELPHDADVRNLEPNFEMLKTLDCRGIMVTSRSADENFDFISRFFAPRYGVIEDPVTGSAHCTLADYWSKKLGKTEFNAYQASKRGGVIKLILRNDRVFLLGKAVTILKGELAV